MKRTLVFASLLSAFWTNMHAMDGGERQRLIEQHYQEQKNINNNDNNNNNDDLPPAYQPPAPHAALAPLGEVDLEANGFPKATDIYNGKLYSADTTTYGQYWAWHNIPDEAQYLSGPMLDQYVGNRERKNDKDDRSICCTAFYQADCLDCLYNLPECEISNHELDKIKGSLSKDLQSRLETSESARDSVACGVCCKRVCCCVCAAGVLAGAITGLVYCCRAIEWEGDYDWQQELPPLEPPYNRSQSYSQSMTQIVTAMVNESKKMK